MATLEKRLAILETKSATERQLLALSQCQRILEGFCLSHGFTNAETLAKHGSDQAVIKALKESIYGNT